MTTFEPAIFDDTYLELGDVCQVGRQRVAVITIDGVEFKSRLPESKADADKINAVAGKIAAIYCE